MKALVHNGKVVQVSEETFYVHADLVWVDAPSEVKENWLYKNNTFSAPPEPHTPDYAYLRLKEYPPITDYLDGVVKGDQAQIDAYIAACLAVKAKYPKSK